MILLLPTFGTQGEEDLFSRQPVHTCLKFSLLEQLIVSLSSFRGVAGFPFGILDPRP